MFQVTTSDLQLVAKLNSSQSLLTSARKVSKVRYTTLTYILVGVVAESSYNSGRRCGK